MHAVSWDIITKSKISGGLGLGKLDVMSIACIMKLGWKILSNADDLWCKVMKNRYKCGDIHDIIKYRGSNSGLWKEIAKFVPYIMSAGV